MTWSTYNGKAYQIYSCRGIRIHHGWEAADMTTRAASQGLASQTTSWIQREVGMVHGFATLKSFPSYTLPPARQHL